LLIRSRFHRPDASILFLFSHIFPITPRIMSDDLKLTKVDSAIAGLSISPKDEKAPAKNEKEIKKTHKRVTSQTEGIWNIKDLEEQKIDLKINVETQKTGWKLNTSPSTVDDKDILKKLLVTPPVKKIDLKFPLGLEVTARNLKGVTIKDALDAIYKQFKKKVP
jgi:hypothetical protein